MVSFLCRRGDLPYSFGTAREFSSPEGMSAHLMLQKSRMEEGETEVHVGHIFEGTSVILELNGRIDCLLAQDGKVLIEEIKTTRHSLKDFIAQHKHLHLAQIKIYAALYALEHSIEEVCIQLTYLQTEPRKMMTFPQTLSIGDLKSYLYRLCARFCLWAESREEWNRSRDASILTADFPYPTFRPGQVEMIQSVFNTIKDRGQMVIQAPTGIGKTIAVLYPALQALAEGHVRKIFYLTSRTTGRVIAEKTLDQLRKSGFRLKSISLTAKEKLCFNPDRCCSPEECSYARGYYDRIEEARLSLLSLDAFTMDIILALAEKHRLCPFELSLDLALWMDCIVCDVNYAFDPRITLKRFFNRPDGYTFLVDESHNLVDRARLMFSAKISRDALRELRGLIDGPEGEAVKAVEDLLEKIEEYRTGINSADLSPWMSTPPEDIYDPVLRLNTGLESWLMKNPPSRTFRRISDFFFETNWFLKVWDRFDENYTTCFGGENGDFALSLFCTDPSVQLGAALDKADSSILFSATLTPLNYFSQILGCRDTVETQSFPSPFPSENQCLLVCDSVSTLFRKREKTKEQLARVIGAFTGNKTGNYLVFFPSYRYMEMIRPIYQMLFPAHHILVQSPRMSEEERLVFLSRFSCENNRTLVGFVVMGGIFGEGIDLHGDRLSGAVVIGVGLPQISVEREVIHNHFTSRDEPGFQYAYLYPGITRVFQAAGRVIRSENDRGAILLIDPRYSMDQYISLFPDEWSLRFVKDDSLIRSQLECFWNGGHD